MKLSSFRRIVSDDYDEKDRPLISKLAYSVNSAIDEILETLNRNVSIADNTNLVIKDITATVSSGVPTTTLRITSGLTSFCRGMQVISATNQTTSTTYPTSQPFINFTENNGVITINHISGLTDGDKYLLRVVLYP